MRIRKSHDREATFCDGCGRVCDSRCRAATLYDRRMLAHAEMRVSSLGALR